MTKTVTIRGVTPDLALRLEELSRDAGRSVRAIVLQILRDALGTHERAQRLRRSATRSEPGRRRRRGAPAGGGLGELEGGFRSGRETADNQVLLRGFLDEPYVSLLPVTREVAVRYGQLFAERRAAGTPVPPTNLDRRLDP